MKACYTRTEVRRMLPVSERQLKAWERHGFIEPTDSFVFSDLIALRALMNFERNKIPLKKVRQAFAAVRARLEDIKNPLKEIKVIADGRRIRVEVGGHRMEPLSGQLLFNFDSAEIKRLLSFPQQSPEQTNRTKKQAAEKHFQRGLECEQTGAVQDAIQSYEAAVALDSRSAGAWLNLGTIYFNAKQYGRAEGYYKKALDSDSSYALAHFNIANLYDERGDYDRAVHHYTEALKLNPTYADAHYNLALLHQGSGQVMDAVRHWTTYLKLDPGSSWGSIARRELEKLRKSTVVQGSRQKKQAPVPS